MDKHLKPELDDDTRVIFEKTTRREFFKRAALVTSAVSFSFMSCKWKKSESKEEDVSDRTTRLAIAYEVMLSGILMNRAILPQVLLKTGSNEIMNAVAIDIWMGASPVYTNRMRTLMGIQDDTVAAIMKCLQLDVGFVHQYMDVSYIVHDDFHGEFWLNHCGALLDTEPAGEEQVFGMCHTIEDPTFDATALATNPKARILPIHRPPRDPADRVPHCHWEITIDSANDPVSPVVITQQVSELPLASVPNTPPLIPSSDGQEDYSGEFNPAFTLADLSTETLNAVQKEFLVQTHLLAASCELSLVTQFDETEINQMMSDAWAGASWIISKRLNAALELDGKSTTEKMASVLSEHPLIPPGFQRDVTVESVDTTRIILTEEIAGLLDSSHPGIPGLLARGERSGWEAMVQAVAPCAQLTDFAIDDGSVIATFTVDPDASPATKPVMTVLMDSLASNWVFTIENC